MATHANMKDDISIGKLKRAYGLKEEYALHPQREEQLLLDLSAVFNISVICPEYTDTVYSGQTLSEIVEIIFSRMNDSHSKEKRANAFSPYIFNNDIQELFKIAALESGEEYLTDALRNQIKELHSQSEFLYEYFQFYVKGR